MAAPKRLRRDRSAVGGRRGRSGLAAGAAMVLAVVCCAAAPAILAVFGSLALGSVLGWAAGAVALVAAVAVLLVIARRSQSGPRFASSKEVER